jgi:hypothetical protein
MTLEHAATIQLLRRNIEHEVSVALVARKVRYSCCFEEDPVLERSKLRRRHSFLRFVCELGRQWVCVATQKAEQRLIPR